MKTIKDSVTTFQKLVMLALLISPIIQTYGWGNFNFSFIIIAVLSLINIINKGIINHNVPKLLILYFIFWYFSHLLSISSFFQVFPLGIIRLLLSLCLFYDCLNINYFIKIYRRIAFICIMFFLFQEFCYYILGSRIPGVIGFLPNSLGIDNVSSFLNTLSEAERSSSFFSEPAHFVQFLLPLLTIELFGFTKKRWNTILIIGLTLLLTQSGNALLGLLIISIAYLFNICLSSKLSPAKKSILLISFIGIGLLLSFIYINSEIGNKLMSRSDTIDVNSAEDSGFKNSAFLRIWRGYFVFDEFDTFYKLIGNDNPEYLDVMIEKSSVYMFFEENERYVNNIQRFLITTGYIGVLLFSLFIRNEWKKTNFCGKTLLALIIALSFIAYLHFSATMIICLVTTYLMPRNSILLEDKKCIRQINI